jgi:demethylmenaquinone methyltransferase/2-methoxy-6-polyprenyl-1,4-benzoquinol methylase
MTAMMPVDGSGAMFDRIARRYDLLNRLMSFGIDRSWRRDLVAAMPDDGRLLDVATGTGDVALSLAKAYPEAPIVGLDPSVGMLEVGRGKVMDRGLNERVRLDEGDAQSMPYPDDHFAGACIAFGIRNVPDRIRGLAEMKRVTRPGGPIVILELSEPRGGVMAAFARIHVHHVVPILGALISGQKEYRYLQKSIQAFPPAEEFCEIMRSVGLSDVSAKRLTLGTAHLYIGHA